MRCAVPAATRTRARQGTRGRRAAFLPRQGCGSPTEDPSQFQSGTLLLSSTVGSFALGVTRQGAERRLLRGQTSLDGSRNADAGRKNRRTTGK